jgi:MFS superfamily sulfate permease-like transporter
LALEAIILDMSSMNFIDSNGVDALIQIKDAYQSINIQFCFANYKIGILKMLKKTAFTSKFDFSKFYPTVHDAVCSIKNIQISQPFEIVTKQKPDTELEIQQKNVLDDKLVEEF